MLEIKSLTKKFKNNIVLNNVNLKINANEIITLLGKNGVGKTTLINCILKLYKPDIGKIFFNGTDIFEIKNKQYYSKISVVLENSENVYDYLSGMDNIKYFLGLSNISYNDYKNDLFYYLDLFDMNNSVHKKVGNYSFGMRQKLSLIIALITNPQLLILDEPTLGLDIKTKYKVLYAVKEIVKNKSMSILLTTHQSEIIEPLNSRIVFLTNGETQEYDSINNLIGTDETYEIEYLNEEYQVVTEDIVDLKFNEIVNKYSEYNIVSINKKEKNIESLIMEKMDE